MPEALRKALDYRSKPRTGYAKFKVKNRVGSAPIVEARYKQRFAGNNVVSNKLEPMGEPSRGDLSLTSWNRWVNRAGEISHCGSCRNSLTPSNIR